MDKPSPELEARIKAFCKELDELEKKHGFRINHHGDHVSWLMDTIDTFPGGFPKEVYELCGEGLQ